MTKIADTLRFLFSPSARRELNAKAERAEQELANALKDHRREVDLFRRALREGPKLKLVVEPRRRSDGRFVSRH